MTTALCCPPVLDLQGLSPGADATPEVVALRGHLEQCGRCLEIWRALHPEDTNSSPAAAQPADSSMTWKGGLRPDSSLGWEVETSQAAPGTAAKLSRPRQAVAAAGAMAAPDATQQLVALLSPPEGAGEIGRIGPYRVLEPLGRGATGVVFLAEDLQLHRRVALKVMRPVAEAGDLARQRFLREARAAAVIDHDHIVTIYQVGEERGLPYLAMKLLKGETLDDRLKRERELLVCDILRIAREIAEGLDAAHEHGLIHRDIKPANIFLEEGGGRVKIVDFGLARAVSDDLHLTRTGTIVGTPAYMSPEQARGSMVDHRSDLFSLGCVLYRMCTGRTPFQAEDTMGMLVALAQDQPPPIKAFNTSIPDPLVGLISRLLAKLPEARPQAARTVVAQLQAIAERVTAARVAGNPVCQPGAERARPRLMVTVLQMVTLAAFSWGCYWYGPSLYMQAKRQLIQLYERSAERSNFR